MNPETITLVRDLAVQLGTTAEHLIALFVPRVIAGALTWLVAGLGTYPLIYLAIKNAHSLPFRNDDRFYAILAAWAFGVTGSLFATAVLCESIMTLAAPEAAAILEILSAIRGS